MSRSAPSSARSRSASCCRRCSLGAALLVVALAGLPLIVLAFALCHLLARLERRRVRGGLRDRLPHPPPPARRQPAQPRAALARLARRLAGALLRARRAAVRRLDRLPASSSSPGAPRSRCSASRSGACSPTAAAMIFGADIGYVPSAVAHVAGGAGALLRRSLARARRRRRAGRDGAAAARAGRARAPDRPRRHARGDPRRHGRRRRRRAPPDRARPARRRAAAARRAGDDARAREGDRGPGARPHARRRGARRGQGGARRAAQPRARHPSRGADRPRARRRRLRARGALPDPGRRRRRPPAPRQPRAARRSPTSSSPRR